jgi:hypothetical protein
MMKKKLYSSGEEQIGIFYFWWISVRIFMRKNVLERFRKFRARRPHRSFRLSRRRDYVRPLKIAGYWSFTKSVFDLISDNKRAFLSLAGLIAGFSFILIGLMDQNFLTSLQDVADTTNGGLFSGGWGEIGKAGLVIMSTFSTGGLVSSPSDSQQMIMVLIALFAWLAVVQLCRNIYAGGRKISVREALYSCGAPIIPMVVVSLVILAQLVPAFIAAIISSAAQITSYAQAGVEQMIFSVVVFFLISISVYWVMGSIFAMIIVTIPGTYPLLALKIAGDMVVQRRLAILKRILWLALVLILAWLVTIIPIILLANWLGGWLTWFKAVPIVQLAMLIMTSLSLVFISCYIYALYRKIVDYDRQN